MFSCCNNPKNLGRFVVYGVLVGLRRFVVLTIFYLLLMMRVEVFAFT